MHGLFTDGVLVGAVAEDAGDCAYKALREKAEYVRDDLNAYLQGHPDATAEIVAAHIGGFSTSSMVDAVIDDYCAHVQHKAESSADGAYLGLSFSISPVVWDADTEEWRGVDA